MGTAGPDALPVRDGLLMRRLIGYGLLGIAAALLGGLLALERKIL